MGKLGDKELEILGNIFIAYLSKNGYLDVDIKEKKKNNGN